MADPNVWAPGVWGMNLLVATLGDAARGKDMDTYNTAVRFFVLQMHCLPCEPCRKYYTHHLLGFYSANAPEGVAPQLSLVNFTHSMRRFVDAKVNGTSGTCVGKTSGHVLQLKKRVATLGTAGIISNEQILTTFMIQCVQSMFQQEVRGVRYGNFRAGCIVYSMLALAHVIRAVRPSLATTIVTTTHHMLSTGKPFSPTATFRALTHMRASLPDMPPATDEEVHARLITLKQAFVKGAEWVHGLGSSSAE